MFWHVVNFLAIFGSLTVLGIAVTLDPDERGFGTHEQLGLAPCDYYVQTGFPCPTCGMTTAFTNMAHFDVPAAFRANPAGVLLFLLTLGTPFWFSHAWWTGQDPFRFASHPVGRWVLPVTVVLLILCWIVRT